jgi:DNA-directed RNA polymerase subunit RPC12/RpoP
VDFFQNKLPTAPESKDNAGFSGGRALICPSCGNKNVHRSHRRWYERPLVFMGVRPYRCHDCHQRFFSKPISPAAKSADKEPRKSTSVEPAKNSEQKKLN